MPVIKLSHFTQVELHPMRRNPFRDETCCWRKKLPILHWSPCRVSSFKQGRQRNLKFDSSAAKKTRQHLSNKWWVPDRPTQWNYRSKSDQTLGKRKICVLQSLFTFSTFKSIESPLSSQCLLKWSHYSVLDIKLKHNNHESRCATKINKWVLSKTKRKKMS